MRLQAIPAIRSASPRIKPFPNLLLLVTYLTAFYLVLLVCEHRDAKEAACLRSHCVGRVRGFLRFGAVSETGWQQIFAYVKKYYLEDATGTYINRNHFAGLLEMVLPFTVALGLHLVGKLRRAAQRSEAKTRSLLSAPELLPWLFALSGRRHFHCARLLAITHGNSFCPRFAHGRFGPGRKFLAVEADSSRGPPLCFSSVSSELLLGWEAIPWSCALRFLDRNNAQTGQNRISIWRDTLNLIHQHPLLVRAWARFQWLILPCKPLS